jgi:anti-sigma regulatory factor (Ser/Thr protein kinase)
VVTDLLCDRLVIGNDLSELRRMTDWLRTSCETAGVRGDVIYKLDFCANEAVANIINYAYESPGPRNITLELSETDGGARLVISDDGKPFNVLEAPEHQIPANIEEARIGGLGIHLIRRLITDSEYRRVDGFNVLSLEAQHNPQQPDA